MRPVAEAQIGNFQDLHGRSLAAALDDANGNSEWETAVAPKGIPQLSRLVDVMIAPASVAPDQPRYVPPKKLLWLMRKLRTGIRVRALNDQTREWEVLPEGFFEAGWIFDRDPDDRDAGRLQALSSSRRKTGPVYLNPRLDRSPAQTTPQSGAASSADKPGPKPGVSGKARAAELADEILRDKKIDLPEGRGRKTRLAELIHKRLTSEGHNHQLDSVKRNLRDLLIG